jgi:hypothetical protein
LNGCRIVEAVDGVNKKDDYAVYGIFPEFSKIFEMKNANV